MGKRGNRKFTIQRDTDLAAILGFEILSVGFDGRTMCNQQRVPHDPGLSAAIAFRTLRAVTCTAGSKEARTIAQNGTAPGLIESNPELDTRTERLEAHPSIVLEILNELVLVQHATVPLVQVVRQVPMEESDHGFDASSTQVVDEFHIVLESLFADGVVAAAEGDDAGPGEGEAVGFGFCFFEQGNVFGGAVVGIAGYVAGAAVCDFAWDAAEAVPDGVCAAVLMGGSFDLVAMCFWNQRSGS